MKSISGVFQRKNGVEYDPGSGSVFKDLEAFAEYKNLVEGGTSAQEAFNQAMANATPAAQEYVKTTKDLELSYDGLHSKLQLQNVEFQAQNHSFSSVRKILNEYNDGLKNCGLSSKDFVDSVGKGNKALGDYLNKLGTGEASMSGYIAFLAKAQIATIGLQVATAALNAVVSAGISWAISSVIGLLDDWVHSAKNAADASKELAKTSMDDARSLKQESDTISELISKYEELASKENQDSSTRSEIQSIQEQISSAVGDQAANIDLVNGNLTTELAILRQIAHTEAQRAKDQANTAYENAQNARDAAIGSGTVGLIDGYEYKDKVTKEEKAALGKYANLLYGNRVNFEQIINGLTSGNSEVRNRNKNILSQFDEDLNTAEGRVAAMTAMRKNLEQNLDDYSSSALYTGLQTEIQNYQNLIDNVSDAAKMALESATTEYSLTEYLLDAEVNSAESYESYRKKLIESISNDEFIKKMVAGGDLTAEGIDEYVSTYMATLNEFSDYYADWKKLDLFNDFKESFGGNLDLDTTSADIATKNAEKYGEAYDTILDAYSRYQSELESAAASGVDLNETLFGNIDTNDKNRILEWTEDNLNTFKDALASWEIDADSLAGGYSTVLGSWDQFGEHKIAFSPIMVTDSGAELLTADAVNEYINKIVEAAGEDATPQEILKLDAEGLTVDGKKIQGIIADIGETADDTASKMHFAGDTGSVSDAWNELSRVVKDTGFDVNQVISDLSSGNFLGLIESLASGGIQMLLNIGEDQDTSGWNALDWITGYQEQVAKAAAQVKPISFSELFVSAEDGSASEFATEVNNYTAQLNKLQTAYEKFNGKGVSDLSGEDLQSYLDLVMEFPEIADGADDLGAAIQNLAQTSQQDILGYLNEQLETNKFATEADKQQLIEFIGVVEKLNDIGSQPINIGVESTNIGNLNTARNEAFGTTGLSQEAIANIKTLFSDLPSYNYDELFERTALGVQLNSEAFSDLQKEYEGFKKLKIAKDLEDLEGQLKDTQDEIDRLSKAGEDVSALRLDESNLLTEIQNTKELQAMYEAMTSSYSKWKAAQQTANASDIYDDISSGYEQAKKMLEEGRIGDDDFMSYVEMIKGVEFDSAYDAAAAFQSFTDNIKGTSHSIADLLAGGKEGGQAFLDTLNEVDSSWAQIVDGKWELDFNIEDAARELGVSVDFITSMLNNLKSYGFDVDLDPAFDTVDELEKKIRQSEKALSELGENVKPVEINTDVENAEQAKAELDTVEDKIEEINNSDLSIEAKTAQLNDAYNKILLLELKTRNQYLLNLDVSNVEEGFQEAAQALLHYEAARARVSAAELTYGADSSQLEEANTALDEAYQKLVSADGIKPILGITDEATPTIDQVNAAIDGLTAETNPIPLKAEVTQENIDEIITGLIGDHEVHLGITVTGKEDVTEVKNAIDGIKASNPVTVSVTTTGKENVTQYANEEHKGEGTVTWDNDTSAVDAYKAVEQQAHGTVTWGQNTAGVSTSFTATGTVNWTNANGPGVAMGTAHAGGTAFSHGNWGTKESGVALGGELGTEIVVRNGRWFTIGDNGAEFFKYKKNDIIFNANQSEQILKYGKIKTGLKRGRAYSEGTAFAPGNATGGGYFWGGSSSGGGGYSRPSSSSSSSSSNKSSSSSDKEETFEKVDWIEIAIARIERIIENFARTAESTFKTLGKRLIATSDQIESIKDEIYIQEQGAARYLEEAASVGLSTDLATKVRNGTIDINEYDEETRELISEYQEWYDKSKECESAVDDLHETLGELYQDRFDNIQSDYENRIDMLIHQSNRYEAKIEELEESGYLATTKYYQEMKKVEQQRLSVLQTEMAHLERALTEAINSGEIEKYSEAWYDMSLEIQGVQEEIDESNSTLAEYEKTMREIRWDNFDYALDRISKITDESNFLIDLLGDKKLFDDSGEITGEGLAVMGLRGQNYNVAMEQAKQYAEEILKLDKEIADDPYNTDLIERREELLSLQQDAISAANDEKQAIVDLVRDGIDAEIDSMQKLIDKYVDALDSAKSLHDYQNKISEHSQEIGDIQKQIIALEDNTSEEGRAALQKKRKELEEARKNLSETEYDRDIDDKKKLLDELMTEYEEVVNSRLDNVDALISDMIDVVNSNSNSINDTLTNAANDVGYTISKDMRIIWQEASYGISSAISSYLDGNAEKITTINNSLNVILETVRSMAQASTNGASKTISGIKKYKTGGYINYTGLAQVDGSRTNPESILNARDTKNFEELRNYMRSLASQNIELNGTPHFRSSEYVSTIGVKSIADIMDSLSVSTPAYNQENSWFGNLYMEVNGVANYEEFMNRISKDKKFDDLLVRAVGDKMTGKSQLSKNHVSW